MTMTIAMIIFAFIMGAAMTAVAMHLFHNELDSLHKADTIVALAQQAQASFEEGYKRSEINHARRAAIKKRQKMSTDVTVLIPSIR